jgi:hypothetical protein
VTRPLVRSIQQRVPVVVAYLLGGHRGADLSRSALFRRLTSAWTQLCFIAASVLVGHARRGTMGSARKM